MTTKEQAEIIARAEKLSLACQDVLRGHDRLVQGAALAVLVSLWLAGHLVPDEIGKAERPETAKIRDELLASWLDAVRLLVPESEKEIMMAHVEPQGRA